MTLALFTAACKKETNLQNQNGPAIKKNPSAGEKTLALTAAQALKGVNWAVPSDNFQDTILVLTGLSSADSYATVEAKTSSILNSLTSNTSANTIRIPINYATTSGSWWNSYSGIIDEATSKGYNVVIGYWEGKSSEDGLVDNTTQYWALWTTVVNKYINNSNVYFECFNEPHGYSESDLATLYAQWLTNYPSVPRGRIILDGTGYSTSVTAIGADSRFSSCLLSVHQYTFFNSGTINTAYQWENLLAGEVGSYGNRTILTEFGDTLNSGINYTGAINGSEDVAYLMGLTNELRTLGMGSIYWPGIKTGDGYGLETLGGSGTSLTLTNVNTSALSRVQYGWSIGDGGTSSFYSGAYYRFINLNSGMALDVNGASKTSGAQVIQWPQNGGTNQQWTLTSLSGGYYEVVNRNSGMVLDVNGDSTAEGAHIIQWPWNSGNNQQWTIASTATGIFKATNRNSGLMLDVNGASVTEGADIIQWPWNSGNNQQWTIAQE